jgi:isopropylmalate/homocitrate/citramalate synthase
MMCDAIRYARQQGATSIEFGGEDGSRADVEYIAEIHREGMRAGGTRPSTPDTVGCYSPFAVREYIPRIKAAAPDAPLVVHFHNDLGLGAWNTVMALGSGAEVFTTSVNGIGERTGNAPMHQVLMQLRYLFGIEIPKFKYEKLRDLAHGARYWLERVHARVRHPHGRHAHPPRHLPVPSAGGHGGQGRLRVRQAFRGGGHRARAA